MHLVCHVDDIGIRVASVDRPAEGIGNHVLDLVDILFKQLETPSEIPDILGRPRHHVDDMRYAVDIVTHALQGALYSVLDIRLAQHISHTLMIRGR